MSVKTVYIPYNPQFNYDKYLEYRKTVEAYGKFVWTIDNMDHMRLPGNINVFELLIYIGMIFKDWCNVIKYSGENILYSPAFPDIIYTLHTESNTTEDSPHKKVPPVIAFRVKRREPASMAKNPFGSRSKMWKFRKCGDFEAPDGNIYRTRYKFWESEVEFICVNRSGAEAEALCIGFEQFMDMNEGKFLEAGLNKMAPLGRRGEPEVKLEDAGLHYRSTRFWFRTQEFQFAGPITKISDTEISVAVNE